MDHQKALSVGAVKIRYFAYNCLEIRLPDGKTLVIDPCIVNEGLYRCGYEDSVLEGCDYVLINHTHMDHIASLGRVYDRFRPLIMAHEMVVWDLANYFDIPYIKMIPFTAGSVFDYGSFRVEVLRARHNPSAMFMVRPSGKVDEFANDKFIAAHLGGLDEDGRRISNMGTIFNNNFLITLPNNLRIALFAGNPGMIEPEDANMWKDLHPDIVFAHRALTSYENWDGRMANILAVTGARVMVPIHIEDGFLSKQDPHQYVAAINAACEKKGIFGRALYMERASWYQFSTLVEKQ